MRILPPLAGFSLIRPPERHQLSLAMTLEV